MSIFLYYYRRRKKNVYGETPLKFFVFVHRAVNVRDEKGVIMFFFRCRSISHYKQWKKILFNLQALRPKINDQHEAICSTFR